MSNWREALAVKQKPQPQCPKCGCDRRIEEHRTYFLCNTCAHHWLK